MVTQSVGVVLGPGGGRGDQEVYGAQRRRLLSGNASFGGDVADQLGGWDHESVGSVNTWMYYLASMYGLSIWISVAIQSCCETDSHIIYIFVIRAHTVIGSVDVIGSDSNNMYPHFISLRQDSTIDSPPETFLLKLVTS